MKAHTGCAPPAPKLHVRHRSRDLDIVNEIFLAGTYAPPRQATDHLRGPLRVLDLGGNVGLFGAYALHAWDVTVLTSYEPDPENARLLRLTAAPFAAWQVVEAAASNLDGDLRFTAGLYSESRAARHDERAIMVPMVDVFKHPADLVKIDIEGGEWALLTDPRLADLARVVVMEWHRLGSPDDDARACASRLLHNAGYTSQLLEPCRYDTNGMPWAWKP